MRYIDQSLTPALPTKWTKICGRHAPALAALTTHEDRSAYLKKHRDWTELKEWLSKISFDKCWYCEAKSKRAPCDVDHFRPKLGTTVDGADLDSHPGYFWLAYEWQNFRLSCIRCNRPENDEHGKLRGKANEFPLQSEAVRCSQAAGTLSAEMPRLLDPCRKEDCTLLLHAIDGEVKAAAPDGSWDNKRACYTIELLGFNSWDVPKEKRGIWQKLNLLFKYADDAPEFRALLSSEYLSGEHEYSSFIRSVIGTHRDKAWVQAIL